MNNKTSKKNTFVDEIVDQIENLEPKTHVRFVLQNILLWSLGISALVFGILSTATIMFILSHAGYDLYNITHESRMDHLLEMLPVMWLSSVVLFGFLAKKLIRLTQYGYRYNLKVIMFGLVTVSIGGGLLLNLLETGRYLDQQAENFIPFHVSLEKRQKMTWALPDVGRIAGVLTEEIEGGIVSFLDFDDVVWKIDLNERYDIWKDEFEMGDRVRIFGKKLEDGTFYVCLMRPWIIRRETSASKMLRPEDMGPFQQELPEQDEIEQNERNPEEGRTSICKELIQKPYTQMQSNIR